jgi:uncharacterized protein YbcI
MRVRRADSSASLLSFAGPKSQERGEKRASRANCRERPQGVCDGGDLQRDGQAAARLHGARPTKARTYVNENLITVVLEDTLTMGERSLVLNGEVDLVLATRKAFQRTMGPELVAAVERESGRKVFAFLSDNRTDPDVAVESFVLVPRAGAAPSGDESTD